MATETPTKQAWTPGPWRATVETHPSIQGEITIASTTTEHCVAQIPKPWINKAANAKLIAKAPELVEALQALVEVVDGLQSGKIWSRHNSDVNNAFDKAERILREAGAL